MVPAVVIFGETSTSARLPFVVKIDELVARSIAPPPPTKWKLSARKSASERARVLATNDPVLTDPPDFTMMPAGLIRNTETLPDEARLPEMSLAGPAGTRLSTATCPGSRVEKYASFVAATLKLAQLIIVALVRRLTSSVSADPFTAGASTGSPSAVNMAAPDTTFGVEGVDCARAGLASAAIVPASAVPSTRVRRMRLRLSMLLMTFP